MLLARGIPRPSLYSAVVPSAPAAYSAIVGAPACPPCALPAAGRLTAAFVRPTAFRGVIAGSDFLAAPLRAVRFTPGLAAAVALFGARFPRRFGLPQRRPARTRPSFEGLAAL